MQKYIPTGNEMLSLPKINEATAAIESLTFLSMQYKGLVDLRGTVRKSLIEPFFEIGGKRLALEGLAWQRLDYWVPSFTAKFAEAAGISAEGIILTPVEERGFTYRLAVTNTSGADIELSYGLAGAWGGAYHCVNEEKRLNGQMHCFKSGWNNGLAFDMCAGAPMFCFAPMTDLPCNADFEVSGEEINYSLRRTAVIKNGENETLCIHWGLGYEEVAAATSAKELLRRGFEYELKKTQSWLCKRITRFENKKIETLYNVNLFFCMFFSTGVTFDTEELIIATSRSPRYYVSAAYWDRDSLFWSFPAVLQADKALAKQMLAYVFGRQRRNIGVHSRFIDGTVLEPGFELDELTAPIIALDSYIEATSDNAFLQSAEVQAGIELFLEKLQAHRHHDIALYDTFLQPTDDEIVHPYITYDNVLVWKALLALAQLCPRHGALAEEACAVKAAVLEHCIKEKDAKRFFAWSVDLKGKYDIYDEPPGSLQLLCHLGFCDESDEVYINTVGLIRSPEYAYSFAGSPIAEIGCPHAPHPWVLSIANSLLCKRVEHCTAILEAIQMDNGIACESVDEVTGECTTGDAFATCAGFLCYAIKKAYKGGNA